MKQKNGRKLLRVLLTLAMAVGMLPGMTLTANAECFHTGKSTYTVKYSSDGTSVEKIVLNFAYGDDAHKSGASGDYVGKTYDATYNLIFTKNESNCDQSTAGHNGGGWGIFASDGIPATAQTVTATLTEQQSQYGVMEGTFTLNNFNGLEKDTQYYALLCASFNPWYWYTGEYIPIKLEPRSVTFDAEGGSPVPEVQCVNKGNKITKPTDPTKDGYTFDGWYKETTCTNAWSFENDTVTNDTTLYAKWTALPAIAPTVTGADDLELTYGYASGSVSVVASAATDAEYNDLSYQWYSNEEAINQGDKAIDGATGSSYAIPTGKSAGTTEYYYCEVTATRTDNGQTETATSDVATVTVQKADWTETEVYESAAAGTVGTVDLSGCIAPEGALGE